ncbi:MAG: hypothetical protein ACK44W_08095 [Planctomycetota bacterium]
MRWRAMAWDPVTSLPAQWRREGELQGQARTYDALGNVETYRLPPGGGKGASLPERSGTCGTPSPV